MKLFLFAIILAFSPLSIFGQICYDSEYATDEYATGEYSDSDVCEVIEKDTPLSIFPNPTSDYFEVRNTGNTEGHIFNVVGQFVRRVNLQSVIDVSDLPKAVYFIRIGLIAHKIIIQ